MVCCGTSNFLVLPVVCRNTWKAKVGQRETGETGAGKAGFQNHFSVRIAQKLSSV